MRLLFSTGPLFYLEFNLRLMLALMREKADLLVANDLDTLLGTYLTYVNKRDIALVYDSHEYFTEVPELEGRWAKKAWLRLEEWIFPKLKHVYTVNQSIADIYTQKYQVPVQVIRNLPDTRRLGEKKSREDLDLPLETRILILQGAGINVDRGAEEAVQAMELLGDNYLLLIIGAGDVMGKLKEIVRVRKLETKVRFIPRLPYHELMQYTMNADLGLSLDKSGSANYDLALPNKIFDSIAAGIPVLVGPTIEAKRLVEGYQVGRSISEVSPGAITEAVCEIFKDQKSYAAYGFNTKAASKELNWMHEERKLFHIFGAID